LTRRSGAASTSGTAAPRCTRRPRPRRPPSTAPRTSPTGRPPGPSPRRSGAARTRARVALRSAAARRPSPSTARRASRTGRSAGPWRRKRGAASTLGRAALRRLAAAPEAPWVARVDTGPRHGAPAPSSVLAWHSAARKMVQEHRAPGLSQRSSLSSDLCLAPTAHHEQPPAAGGQPLPVCWQHHACLGTDQSACQVAKPTAQSKGSEVVGGGGGGVGPAGGSVGHPRRAWTQHHALLPMDHLFIKQW